MGGLDSGNRGALDTRLNNLIQSNQQQQPTPAWTARTEFILPEFHVIAHEWWVSCHREVAVAIRLSPPFPLTSLRDLLLDQRLLSSNPRRCSLINMAAEWESSDIGKQLLRAWDDDV